jgi:hypothetical protein
MAQGLNFQTHQYVDPSEQLQKSLGAGGMFAQTLKGMQQFDQDEAKLQMMRDDRARQAKIDAQNEADRAAAAAKEAADLGLQQALFQGAVKDDVATTGYQALSDSDKAALNSKDSYAGYNAGAIDNISMLKMLEEKGVTKGDSVYDDLSYKIANGGNTLNANDSVETLANVYKKTGMKDADAISAAASKFGISSSDASNILSTNQRQREFGALANKMSTEVPYQKSKSEITHDYLQKMSAEGKVITGNMYAAATKTLEEDNIAMAKQREKIVDLEAKIAAGKGAIDEKQWATALEMEKIRMQNLQHGMNLLAGGSDGGNSQGYNQSNVKRSYQSDALNAATEAVKSIKDSGNEKNTVAVNNAYTMVEGMMRNNASPAQIKQAVLRSLVGSNSGEKESAFNKLKFDSKLATTTGTMSEADAAMYTSAMKNAGPEAKAAYEAEAASSMALLKQMASGGQAQAYAQLAALNKQYADLNRTPGQAMDDTAKNEVRQWAIDQGLSGAVTVNNNERALAAKVEKTARAEREKLLPASPTSKDSSGTKTGDPLYDKASAILSKKENPDPYGIHADKYESTGNIRPAIGKGFLLADVNKEFAKAGLPTIDVTKPGWNKYKLNADQKKVVDQFEYNFISRGLAASKSALSKLDPSNAGYNDIVAGVNSGFHQYGSGSKVMKPVIDNVQKLILEKKFQEAIDYTANSPYGRAYPERAVDLMDGIQSYAKADGYKGKLVADKKFGFKDKASFIKFYNEVDKWTEGMDPNDREKTLKGLRDRAADAKYEVKFRGYEDSAKIDQIVALRKSLQASVDANQKIVTSNRKAYNDESYFSRPGDKLEYMAGDWKAMNALTKSKGDLRYVNDAKAAANLKSIVDKYPKDLSSVEPEKRVAMNKKIDQYNEAVAKLKLYETVIGSEYMEKNGIPLYSALYKGK